MACNACKTWDENTFPANWTAAANLCAKKITDWEFDKDFKTILVVSCYGAFGKENDIEIVDPEDVIMLYEKMSQIVNPKEVVVALLGWIAEKRNDTENPTYKKFIEEL